MRWFDLKVWATCVLALSACSDDGVPLTAGETDGGASGSATATASGGDPSAGTSAVTTADPSSASSSDSDTADTTDPTDTGGATDSGSTTAGPGSTGADESSGTSGDSSGSTTGGTADPECIVDDDCMLVNDCCSCEAIPVGEKAPECDIEACLVPTCTAVGVGKPAVECNFGTCEVEEVSCNPMLVTCDGEDAEPPACPEGHAPRVIDGCWGSCVPVEYCDIVPSCDACGADEACVEAVTQLGPSLQCVPIPPSCDGAPSCDCLGEVCEDPFDLCSDGIGPNGSELSCSCPAC